MRCLYRASFIDSINKRHLQGGENPSLHFVNRSEMDDCLTTFDRVLSLAGVTIYAKEKWDSKSWVLYQTFNVFMGSLTIILTTGFVIDNISDLPILIEGLSIWTTGVIMFISLAVCLVFRRDFRSFLEEMGFKDAILEVQIIQDALHDQGGRKFQELKHLVLKTQHQLLRLITLLLKTYVGAVFLVAIMYILGAIFLMCVREDKDLRILAYKMWFPWSLEDMRVYVATFIFHCYSGYLTCIAYPGLQVTIVLLVGQMIRQIRIITFLVRNLDALGLEMHQKRHKEWQTFCTNVLSQCVRHYVKLKRFNNRLKTICQPFYLALILVATMLVCVCSAKIAISNKTSPELIKYYIHEFCFIMVVLLFCLLGQQIQNECEKLEAAVFDKWYIFDQRHKGHLMIFHLAVGEQMPIYIFGSTTLSSPTFSWFIRTGASFFTLMMSFLEEQ